MYKHVPESNSILHFLLCPWEPVWRNAEGEIWHTDLFWTVWLKASTISSHLYRYVIVTGEHSDFTVSSTMMWGRDKGMVKIFHQTWFDRTVARRPLHFTASPCYRKHSTQTFMRQGAEKQASVWLDAVCYCSPEHCCKENSYRLAIRATHTQENKGVYKPACGDDCLTVPETTGASLKPTVAALNGGFHCEKQKPGWTVFTTVQARFHRKAHLFLPV